MSLQKLQQQNIVIVQIFADKEYTDSFTAAVRENVNIYNIVCLWEVQTSNFNFFLKKTITNVLHVHRLLV